ncbi:hypothetical protein EYR41_008595 [Orbilia oligospora]|uniref:Uncharacterized protein n=1 Tax=Orbilia oligospora TaxID=2813651 RepID=A0A8H2DWJ6_ORBOL|nr:hypothetical protein TWF128_011706 [Orbilia oligospora]KAF3248021.1 hypothetical protein TWF217_009478 [Orbilia oligospora]KAF3274476.1 hypothetical protein TWF132_003529 [Orbilia oligospora]TGJ67009.1 hypothetical protein EYR41_008595 [Orbilia oligospora]
MIKLEGGAGSENAKDEPAQQYCVTGNQAKRAAEHGDLNTQRRLVVICWGGTTGAGGLHSSSVGLTASQIQRAKSLIDASPLEPQNLIVLIYVPHAHSLMTTFWRWPCKLMQSPVPRLDP